jgi:hypothetical protein
MNGTTFLGEVVIVVGIAAAGLGAAWAVAANYLSSACSAAPRGPCPGYASGAPYGLVSAGLVLMAAGAALMAARALASGKEPVGAAAP